MNSAENMSRMFFPKNQHKGSVEGGRRDREYPDELVGEGVDVIFVTFPHLFPEIIRTAIEHPEQIS